MGDNPFSEKKGLGINANAIGKRIVSSTVYIMRFCFM
jgi:hypothetical protein